MDIWGRGGQRGSKWVISMLIGGYLLMSYRVSGGSNGQRGDQGGFDRCNEGRGDSRGGLGRP